MVEQESHGIAFAVEALDSLVKCSHQIVESLIDRVGQYGPLKMFPQPFNEVWTWIISRQPVDAYLTQILLQKRACGA